MRYVVRLDGTFIASANYQSMVKAEDEIEMLSDALHKLPADVVEELTENIKTCILSCTSEEGSSLKRPCGPRRRANMLQRQTTRCRLPELDYLFIDKKIIS